MNLSEILNTKSADIYNKEKINPSNFFNNDGDDNWGIKNLMPFKLSLLGNVQKKLEETLNIAQLHKDNEFNQFDKIFCNYWDNAKDKIVNVYRDSIEIYNENKIYFINEYQHIISKYKNVKKQQNNSASLFSLLNNDELKFLFSIYVIDDILTSCWNIIKTPFGISRQKLRGHLDELNYIKNNILNDSIFNSLDVIKDNIQNISDIINLSSATTLAAISINECIAAETKMCQNEFENNNNNITSFNDSFLEKQKFSTLLNETSILLNIPNDTINTFDKISTDANSDNLDEINKNNDTNSVLNLDEINKNNDINSVLIECCPSICPVFDDNNLSNNDNANDNANDNENNINNITNGHNEGYIIEIGNDINTFNINLKENDYVSLDQEIGHINNIPIKSIIEGIVVNKSDRYAIIKKETHDINLVENIFNNNLILSSDMIKSDENYNTIKSIQDGLEDMNNIELLLLNNCKCLLPVIIKGNTIFQKVKSPKCIDVKKEIANKEEQYSKIINDAEDNIKSIFSENNIKQQIKANKSNEIKNSVLKIKNDIINDSVKLFNNCVSSKITNEIDYNICNDLLEFLSYNEDNKRYLELFDIIKQLFIEKIKYEQTSYSNFNKEFNEINLTPDKIYIDTNKSNDFDVIFNYIKKHLDEIKITSDNEINAKKYTRLYLISLDIKNITFNKIKSEKEHYLINNKISQTIIKHINSLLNEYLSIKNKIDIDNIHQKLFNFVSWPNSFKTYLGASEYDHYLFTTNNNIVINNDDENNQFDDILDFDNDIEEDINSITNFYSGVTKYDIPTINYWIKYCALASLMNCVRIDMWSTGFISPAGKTNLPIVLIPIKYIQGEVSVLIGLGICGIAIYPMVLMMNLSNQKQSVLIPLNNILNLMRKTIIDLKNAEMLNISKSIINPIIKSINEKIKNTKIDIKNIKDEILKFKSLEI